MIGWFKEKLPLSFMKIRSRFLNSESRRPKCVKMLCSLRETASWFKIQSLNFLFGFFWLKSECDSKRAFQRRKFLSITLPSVL